MRLTSPTCCNRFKTVLILTLLITTLFMLNSCGRCDGCEERAGGIVFNNFSRADLDSVIVKEYVAGTNFATIKDSIISVPILNQDSISYTLYLSSRNLTNQGYCDLSVYVPADSATYKITNVLTTPTHCKRCPQIQLYNITTYYVNGVKDSLPVSPIPDGNIFKVFCFQPTFFKP